ncbi:BMP family ABC transporter substrate-binding protein [Macrococcus capreoli]|uniref:BMP family ABC transporter substrate-binding protein n=1 Tax=Macrococcus capreoli TaxID=2982690 RepID=UPI0021D5CF97|nr:BMP family ABC transporter substrate-binding protein [Macrococcus sp. TMW 2.2395]MCU7556417.1 BMP family ABC transporter substrate-binding protein [Macrococcus sp. TMW 2.2395]
MKNFLIFLFVFLTILGAIVYMRLPSYKTINSVGFVFPYSIHDQTWGTEGYKAVLNIVQEYDTNFYIQENIDSDQQTRVVLDQLIDRDVSIIYGQSSRYEKIFNEYAEKYPNVHFVFTNGQSQHKNVTALNLEAYSMGFFAGYIASHESASHKIAVIAAFEDQPEVKGYIDGAHYENEKTQVQTKFVKTWGYHKDASLITKNMIKQKVDVFYPAADGINSEVMNVVKEYDRKAIGYISDQSYLGDFVIASTVQDISHLYQSIAKDYSEGRLKGGTYFYGMKDNISGLSGYSPLVNSATSQKMERLIKQYKSTGMLPNGKKSLQTEDDIYKYKNDKE